MEAVLVSRRQFQPLPWIFPFILHAFKQQNMENSGNNRPWPQLKITPFLHEITNKHGFHICTILPYLEERSVAGLSKGLVKTMAT